MNEFNRNETIEIANELVSAVAAVRREKGISRHQLSRKVGIGAIHLKRIEELDMIPRLDTFLRITEALGMEIEIRGKEE